MSQPVGEIRISHYFSRKNVTFRKIVLHNGSVFILINKITILPHKYFFINLCTYYSAFYDLTILHLSLHLTFSHPFLPCQCLFPLSKIQCSPSLVTHVKKEITPLWPNSNILFTGNIYNIFIKYIVLYYEIHLKYCQDTDGKVKLFKKAWEQENKMP